MGPAVSQSHALIALGNSIRHALVDAEDHARVAGFTWTLSRGGYARFLTDPRTRAAQGLPMEVLLHRFVLGFPSTAIDHINGDRLDNRRCNLRPCTAAQNNFNVAAPNAGSASPFRGVGWRADVGKWRARIIVDGKQHCLGFHGRIEEAIAARVAGEAEHFGAFAPRRTA